MSKYTITIVDNETEETHIASGDELLINLATMDSKGLLRTSQLQTVGHYDHLSRMHLLLGGKVYDSFFKDNEPIIKEKK